MTLPGPEEFGRVAVVFGGPSPEREVSLASGKAVLDALLDSGVDAIPVDGIPALIEASQTDRIDRVFNIMHGAGGEDGQLAGVLDALEIPYTGSGVLASALSMDKVITKELWQYHGLPTADFMRITSDDLDRAVARLGLPLVVKPVASGSSVGVSVVRESGAMRAAFDMARETDAQVMAEAFVGGGEYTVGIVGSRTLPAVRIRPAGEFYDYHAKYVDDATGYDCPAGLSADEEHQLGVWARDAFDVLRMTGWGRVDFLRDANGAFWLLEANTTPGMTSHSLVPKAAAYLGTSFPQLCLEILATSFIRRNSL